MLAGPTRLWIIPPSQFRYRDAFYSRLAHALASLDIDCSVIASAPPPSIAARADTSAGAWTREVPAHWFRLGRREVALRSVRQAWKDSPPDLVIVEQAIRNLETYRMLASRRTGVATWGHGRSYSTPQSRLEATAKQWVTRRAEWFFAYTASGARHVIDRGMPPQRVTVVNNTIDTDALRADLAAVSPGELAAFRQRLGLLPERTALFLGGVDDNKGIDFLLRAARICAERLPGFVLLVAGTGKRSADVERAQANGLPVRALGRVDGTDRALALAAADVVAVPEWIGLVAVDALVAGRPIVSTDHASHSPEREYLTDRTSLFTAHDVDRYAQGIVQLLDDPARRQAMAAAAREDAMRYSLGSMVNRFVDGVVRWREWRSS